MCAQSMFYTFIVVIKYLLSQEKYEKRKKFLFCHAHKSSTLALKEEKRHPLVSENLYDKVFL